MNLGGYKIFDHTADIGLKAWGFTLPHLFFNVTRGMLFVLGAIEKEKGVSRFSISITADSAEELLLNWLREVLFVIEQKKVLIESFQFEMFEVFKSGSTCCYLKGFILGNIRQSTRHDFCTEIKAITRHLFFVKKVFFIWKANLIFDL